MSRENDAKKYAFVAIEVSGIQNFIFSTGRLKEMVGASQAVLEVVDHLHREIIGRLGLKEVDQPKSGSDWTITLQNKAGSLRAVFPDRQIGRDFMTEFAAEALDRWPGLPLNGALDLAAWETEDIEQSRQRLSRKIDRQRAIRPVPVGLSLLPVVEMAPLDGLAAVADRLADVERDRTTGKTAWLSLPSRTRRDANLLAAADKRLKDAFNKIIKACFVEAGHDAAWEPRWCDDFDEMLEGRSKPRLALVHLDVNDLGRFFKAQSQAGQAGQAGQLDPAEAFERRKKSSRLIDDLNKESFEAAVKAAMLKDAIQADVKARVKDGFYRLPLRPLVMGGDDVTILVRADLALTFVKVFVETYEATSRQQDCPFSLGVGMLIMPPSYPFLKAYRLVEDLCSSAKTATKNDEPRGSSLDYLVVTNDVEDDLAQLRARIARGDDGSLLTGKPFKLADGFLDKFLDKARRTIERLPRSHTRQALNDCRLGRAAAWPAYSKLRENVRLGLGGRHGRRLLNSEEFDDVFPPENGFFVRQEDGRHLTYLADYLELADYL